MLGTRLVLKLRSKYEINFKNHMTDTLRSPQANQPWTVATITLISIFFTPIVGSILAGLNQRLLGFPQRARKDYSLALYCFLVYVLYFGFSGSFFFGIAPQLRLRLLIPTFAAVHEVSYAALLGSAGLPFLLPVLLFLVLPSTLFVLVIYKRQRKSWRERANSREKRESWWKAYLLATILTPVIGFLLAAAFTLLNSEATGCVLAIFIEYALGLSGLCVY
jgi:phosphate/sulfate permease